MKTNSVNMKDKPSLQKADKRHLFDPDVNPMQPKMRQQRALSSGDIFKGLDIDALLQNTTFLTQKEEAAVQRGFPRRQSLLTPLNLGRRSEARCPSLAELCEEGEEGEEGEHSGPCSAHDSTINILDLVSSQTNNVLKVVEMSVEDRRKNEIKEELDRIIDRIEITLIHSGDDGVIPRDVLEAREKFSMIQKGKEFNLQEAKAELQRKQQMVAGMVQYAASLTERSSLMQELSDWLQSCDDLERGCLSEEQWEEREAAVQDIRDEVESAFGCAQAAADTIRDLGFRLLKEAGYIDDDDDDGPKRKMRPFEMEDVLDETQLQEDESLGRAMREIKMILDQAIRFVRLPQHKNVLRAGIKQHKNVMKSIGKRVEDFQTVFDELSTFKGEFELMVTTAEIQKTQIEALQNNVTEVEEQNVSLDIKVRDLTAENSELQSIVAELETYRDRAISMSSDPSLATAPLSDLTAATSSLTRTASHGSQPHTNSRNSVHKEIEMTASMLDQATRTLKQELSNTKKQLTDTQEKLQMTEKQLSFACEEIEQLGARIAMMDEMSGETSNFQNRMKDEAMFSLKTIRNERDSLEKQVAQLAQELACKNEVIEFQERRLKDMKGELGLIDMADIQAGANNLKTKDGKPIPEEVKGMIHHLKKDMEGEIDRLRKHLEKEKNRHEATTRKIELKHKDDNSNTFKQSLHLLRAINRFKDSTATLLDRENLPVAAADVRRIPKLPVEEMGSDARILLTQMAGNAVELLVSIEFKLSQALMNKRLEVKDNSIAKNFAAKDLESQMEAAQRAKKAAESMAGTMKELKSKLMTAEEHIAEMRKLEDDRYKGLAERYRKLMYQYTQLQKENSKKQLETKKNLKDKSQALSQMASAKNSMAQMVEEQQGILTAMHRQSRQKKETKDFEMQLSIVDQKQNLNILEKALKDNKISKEMYTLTVDLIKQSMDLPLLKLKNLMQKYISYRRLQHVKAYLREQLQEDGLGGTKHNVEKYMSRMDDKLEKDQQEWQKQRIKLENKRRGMFGEMNELFSDVIVETGVMLLVPEDRLLTIPSAVSIHSRATTQTSSSSGNQPATLSVFKGGVRGKSPLLEMPDGVYGTSMAHLREGGAGCSMWQVNSPRVLPPIRPAALQTPRLLEYDIQQQLKAAQRALAGIHYRSRYPLGTASGCDYSLGGVSDLGYGDSEGGSLDTASHYTTTSDGIDSGISAGHTAPAGIDNTMVNIRVDIKVKDQHYVDGTGYKRSQ